MTHPLLPPNHELYMHRALQLATLGQGHVSPNPLVGCVIVQHGRIIGEGAHLQYGRGHAEVNAIADVKDATQLPGATLYVNLEPCAHFGKTPPCAPMLVQHKIARVVIANTDPNPLVAGKGIAILQDAGIAVITNVLAQEGARVNRHFFTFINKQRPYIFLKWAQTADGYMARPDFTSQWISNPLARKLAHKWRTEHDAVFVGANTVRHDNPRLNVREWTGRNPIRITFDRNLALPTDLHIFDGSQMTYIFNTVKNEKAHNLEYVQVSGDEPWADMLTYLHAVKVQSLMVEGGAQVLNYLLQNNLWDEACIIQSENSFGAGIAAPRAGGHLMASEKLMDNWMWRYGRQG